MSIRIRVQAVLINEGKLLLVKHVKNGKEYWVLPGGGVEYRETVIESLKRELKEELNIDLKTCKLITIRDFIPHNEDRHILDIYFFCTADISGIHLAEQDGILSDYGFFSIEELGKVTVFPSKEFVSSLIKEVLGDFVK